MLAEAFTGEISGIKMHTISNNAVNLIMQDASPLFPVIFFRKLIRSSPFVLQNAHAYDTLKRVKFQVFFTIVYKLVSFL